MAQQTLNTPRETTHQRIAAALEAIEQNMSDEHEAVNIDYDNTYSGLSADNVQEAIDELVNEKADKSTTLAGYGITDAYTKTETDTLLDGKVDKITGKGLSTNDYTTADKNKLAGIEAEANKTVVDSVMSDSSTNPLQNKVITKELEGTKTTTGNPLTIEDAAPVNAVNLSMDLEPIQDLHGYDHPWVGGAGKNKWNGSVSTSNVFSSAFALPASLLNFTISLKNDSGKQINGVVYNSSGTKIVSDFVIAMASATSGTKNITVSEQAYLCIYTTSASGTDASKVTEVQVESGSTATSYEPYTNICPISGWDAVKVNVIPDGFEQGAISASPGTYDDCKTESSTRIRTKELISLDTTKTTVISVNSEYDIVFQAFDSNGIRYNATGSNEWVNGSINITGVPKIAIAIKNHDNTSNITPSELPKTGFSFQGKTYTIQLGDTVYGGTLDVTRGKMVVTHGEVDLGTLSWSYNRVFFINGFTQAKLPSSNSQIANIISSAYKAVADDDVLSTNGATSLGTTGQLCVNDSRYTSVSDFITAVTGQTLVYELATPYTIQLTPQQIKLLENTNTIYTDYEEDTITIEYQPNNAIGEAVRAVEESYDPEFAVRPPLKKIAFSGTTDSDGSVTLISASDIPSGHKIIPLHITDMTINGSAGTYFVEYKPYNSGDSVKGYCYTYYNGSQTTPVGTVVTGNFYYYDLEG